MTRNPLTEWLGRLEARSPEARVDLGLSRVSSVLDRLGPDLGGRRIITVAGTNGKGSVVAFIEQIALAAGYHTFAYSSPHLVRFGERMRSDGQPARDETIATAFEQVEEARGNVPLTYFEHVTLAALQLAADSPAEILVLEVGLGGRLDAVNAVDPDVSIITSIGLDHAAWLGRTRLSVGREKAGIARPGRPLIVGEKKLPRGMSEILDDSRARLILAGRDFNWRATREGFFLVTPETRRKFPAPAMIGRWQQGNAACAVMALEALGPQFGMGHEFLGKGISVARLPGRFQRIGHSPEVIVDVAHNPAAARCLAEGLGSASRPSTAVFSVLDDKNVAAIARPLDRCFDQWIVASLPGPRAMAVGRIVTGLRHAAVTGGVETVESVPEALRRALDRSAPHGRVVVFGSFHTVAAVWPVLKTLE